MENVEETKLRILREAIQSNVEGSRSTSKPKARLTLKRTLARLALGFFADRKLCIPCGSVAGGFAGKGGAQIPDRGHDEVAIAGSRPGAELSCPSIHPVSDEPSGAPSFGQANRDRPRAWG